MRHVALILPLIALLGCRLPLFSNPSAKDQISDAEGKTFIMSTHSAIYHSIHTRADCRWATDVVEVTAKNGRVVDSKGFFYDPDFCRTCNER